MSDKEISDISALVQQRLTDLIAERKDKSSALAAASVVQNGEEDSLDLAIVASIANDISNLSTSIKSLINWQKLQAFLLQNVLGMGIAAFTA